MLGLMAYLVQGVAKVVIYLIAPSLFFPQAPICGCPLIVITFNIGLLALH